MRKFLFLLMFLVCLGVNIQAQQAPSTHVWEFNDPVVNNKVEGWEVINYANPNTSNGILNLTASTAMGYPDLQYKIPADVALDPQVSKQVIIRLKNGTKSRRARFYWNNIRYDFLVSVEDTDFTEYVIDLSYDTRWSGNIDSIRFEIPMPVPENSNGAVVSIDYIKILEAPAPPAQMSPFTPPPFGVNLAGAEFSTKEDENDYQYPHSAELDYFKEKGLMLMRVPFKWERLQPQLNGPFAERDINELRNLVWEARKRGMWILLDMHNYGRRKDNGVERIIGDPALTIDHVGNAWQMIADEFKDFGNIYAYGIMNEPHDMRSDTPWFDIAQGIINSIRATDVQTPIMVGGPSWSSSKEWPRVSDDLRHLIDPSNDLIYEAHVYFDATSEGLYKQSYDDENASPATGVNRLAPFVNWLNTHGLRGFVGEYGIPDNDPRWNVVLENALQYLKENGVNGTYWAAGSRWGANKMSVHPNNDGSDRPQMAVLENFLYADNVSHTPPPQPGPGGVSYWSFNQSIGDVAIDSWGSNLVTLNSGASFAGGKRGNGLKLDGTSSGYASLREGVMSTFDDFTISGWVNLDAINANTRLFDFGNNEYSFMAVILGSGGSGGNIRFASRTSSGTAGLQTITSTAISSVGTWQHIAVTKTGNLGILYVDGVEVARNENLTFKPSDLGSTTRNWLGKSQWTTNPNLNGTIDDFKIHNLGLTASEIAAEFQGTTPPPLPGQDEISYWNFNETGGAIADDSWGSNIATLNAGATFAGGKSGNGLKLDGTSNGYATLPNGIVSTLDDFTISSWVNLDAINANTRLFDFGNNEYAFMAVVLGGGGSGGNIRFASRTSSGSAGLQTITSTATSAVGNWQHIAVTKSGNLGVLYVDGIEVARNENLTFKPSDLGNTSRNWLGKSQWSVNPNLNGTIDDFKVFSRALTSAEVLEMKNGTFIQGEGEEILSEQLFSKFDNISIFPNPSSGNFNLIIDTPERGEVIISLYSNSGVLLESFRDVKKGRYEKKIKFEALRSSLYYLKISVGGASHSKVVIVE